MEDDTTRHIRELAAETAVLRIALKELSTHLPTIAQREDFASKTRKKVVSLAESSGEPARSCLMSAWEQLGIR